MVLVILSGRRTANRSGSSLLDGLKRIAVDGSGLRDLADAPTGFGGAWNRDDVIIFAPSQLAPLASVSAAGGQTTAITQLENGQGSHRFPQFLPDQRRFIFVASDGAPETRGVYLASMGTMDRRRILAEDSAAVYVSPGYLLWTQQGLLVAQTFDLQSGSLWHASHVR